ncbi:MAG: hypothetical protein PWR27_656 [Petroclostridium sp.]|jgi:hypothetical protein|nr:hypothetical protein [Clostridia bacterium]MDK2809947.1 hypothetical protein [Petroclostridium sp.]
MSKLVKQRSKKAGLPPGTLIHRGNEIIDNYIYSVYSSYIYCRSLRDEF